MRLRPIADWGMSNWAVIPTVVVGGSLRIGNWWAYVYWLRGRLGVSRR